ncbi:hypothetical protein SKA58_19545 [Sphingomonas sp. SKA58]|jgi:hypothetical protein|uniref:hypothetical protein n=1 Tax=Sphingomonas sp. (strain SKA58) TaxID=314266 RepID=UPI0000D7AE21|nr:hypothetical protein [Sphingomonas sp. SKA58]EAT07458.1 hypothetical protein SKA58_19545 [Sphingomonas sp. SKA58]
MTDTSFPEILRNDALEWIQRNGKLPKLSSAEGRQLLGWWRSAEPIDRSFRMRLYEIARSYNISLTRLNKVDRVYTPPRQLDLFKREESAPQLISGAPAPQNSTG